MSDRLSHNLDGLDMDLARRIDEVCRRFEAAWREGRQPRIDDYLVDVLDEGRLALRAELEALERELRQAEETAARPEARAATSPEPLPAPPPSTLAEAPTVAPGTAPVSSLPSAATAAIHDEATLPPRDEATVDLVPAESAQLDAAAPVRVRYFGDYQILREIARGGMGVVFHARQMTLNRPVALKMILAGQLANEVDVKRFYTEAEAAANLDHPGIVPIFEVGQHEEQHYFSMGFVEGQSLSQRLADGPLPAREAAELIRRVSEAIEYAHQHGVIHRDLKPGNILIDAQGSPRITDFGLAKKVQGGSDLTGSGQIMGTPSYMPPEQAGGKRGEVGPAADVYALGATLYALVTGRPPFQAATPMDTVLQLISDEPVPPRRLNASIPRDLETICLKCLEKAPPRRYASAQALADDLGRWLRGEPIMARPAGRLERMVKWSRRNPAAAAWLAAIPLLMFLGQEVGFMAGCLAAAMTIPLVRNPRLSQYGAVLGALFMLVLVSLNRGPGKVLPSWDSAGVPWERIMIPVLTLAVFGWLGGVVLASFQTLFPRRGTVSVLAFGLVTVILLLLPNLPLIISLNSQPTWLAGLVGVLIGRSGIISGSLCGAIVGLGIGLLEGQLLRETAAVASRSEPEISIIWGMVGAILGITVFEILFIGFVGLNPHLFSLMVRYPYPTFPLLRFYYLGLGSFLGLSVASLVGRRI
jgi:hypothetical protein